MGIKSRREKKWIVWGPKKKEKNFEEQNESGIYKTASTGRKKRRLVLYRHKLVYSIRRPKACSFRVNLDLGYSSRERWLCWPKVVVLLAEVYAERKGDMARNHPG